MLVLNISVADYYNASHVCIRARVAIKVAKELIGRSLMCVVESRVEKFCHEY